ncbi:PAS domain-containing protein [Streptacidiphilus monticola]
MDTNPPADPGESGPEHTADDTADAFDDAVTRAVFSQAPVGLHVFDPDLRLVRVNTAASRIRDFPVDRMIGSTLGDLLRAFSADDPAPVERTVRQVLATGRPARDVVVRVRSRSKPPVAGVASASVFRLEDPEGRVLGVVSAVTDITARARAEAGLRLLNEAASLVGTTLDIFRTAEEFCRHAVPALADTVAVDVFDAVMRGQAPTAAAVEAGRRCGGPGSSPGQPTGSRACRSSAN